MSTPQAHIMMDTLSQLSGAKGSKLMKGVLTGGAEFENLSVRGDLEHAEFFKKPSTKATAFQKQQVLPGASTWKRLQQTGLWGDAPADEDQSADAVLARRRWRRERTSLITSGVPANRLRQSERQALGRRSGFMEFVFGSAEGAKGRRTGFSEQKGAAPAAQVQGGGPPGL